MDSGNIYHSCFNAESAEDAEKSMAGYTIQRQKPLPVIIKGTVIDCGYCLDMVIEDAMIIELKSIEKILPVHTSQLLSYLRLTGLSSGLLINFNVELLKKAYTE